MVAQDYWWSTLKEDVEHWTRSCVECQAVKVTGYNKPKIVFFLSGLNGFILCILTPLAQWMWPQRTTNTFSQ